MAKNKIEDPHVTFCIRNKIFVYPILFDSKSAKYKIEALVKGKKKTFKKIISSSEIDESMRKTYKFYYEKYKDT